MEKHVFEIKSGEATSTLPQIARQGTVDVMFAVGIAKGVQTNAVDGTYTPLEALEIMLANTPLKIVEDRETGAFAITRVSEEAASKPKPDPTSNQLESEPRNTPDMTKKNGLFNSIVSGLAAVLTMSAPATAQDREDDEIVTLETYQVYGAAQEASVAKQRNSDIIGNYLSSDALSELPDDDLGEALSRLAGINVIGGEGNTEAAVTIRGAAGQYNTIRINGAAPGNARLGQRVDGNNDAANSRVFDLNQIPAEMVSSVEVIKSITAQYPADSIGGSVNVETANAFDLGRRITRYKFETRQRDQGGKNGWGANIVHADILDAFGGEDNFGMLFNINFVDEDLVGWSTQNRFMTDNQLNAGGSFDPADDPLRASIAQQTLLEVNPNASIPIWDRFDPNEVRTTKDQLTFNASLDFIMNDRTSWYIRPWYQEANQSRDGFAFRIDRLGTVLAGNYWFLDDSGSPIGNWEDSDMDGILGSADDTFIQGTDGSGNIIVTPEYEANGTGNGSTDGRINRIINAREITSESFTLDIGGETELDNGFLEYRVYFSEDKGDNNVREWRFQERFRDGRVSDHLRVRMLDGSTPLPEFIVFEVDGRGSHVPTNGEANYFSTGGTPSDASPRFLYENVSEDIFLANVDYEFEANDNLTIKVGGRYRSNERENFTTQLFFTPSEGSRRVYPVSQFADASNAGGFTLWDDRYADLGGPFLVQEPVYDFFFSDYQNDPDGWAFNRSDLRDAVDTADLKESVLAGYFQGTLRWDDWTLVAGVRAESTDLNTTWRPSNFIVDGSNIPGLSESDKATLATLVQEGVEDIGYTGSAPFTFGNVVDDINATNSYENLLPSAVLTYRAGTSGHVFRFAWTNTLTRPDYRELVPFNLEEANRALAAAGVLNFTNREEEFHIGNPNLNEQTSENFDLAWEYYFGENQRNMISVTFFNKDLEDFLQLDQFTRDREVIIDLEDPEAGTEIIETTNRFWTNASSRNIEGVEVTGFFHFADLFPDWDFLHGISFVPNYAKITGDQTNPIYDMDELENGNIVVIGQQLTDSLTNQAEEVYNLQLFWENPRLSTRLSYNYISRLQRSPSTAAISALTFDRESENLNLSVQYRLFNNKDIRLFFEGNNLNDAPSDERYIGNTPGLYTTSYATIGRRYVIGVRGSF